MERADYPEPGTKSSWAARRKAVKPKAISASEEDLIKTSFVEHGTELPLVIEPRLPDLRLSIWASGNKDLIEASLSRHGGVLFRGFGLRTQRDFEEFLESVCSSPMTYMESATPRTRLSSMVYTSTEFPADQHIALHNELSYVSTFPTRIWFFCVNPAERGGETPIANVQKVFERIPERIKAPFLEKGWMLMRNFGDGFGPSWQDSYHVGSKAEAEQYFLQSGIEFYWKSADRLRTKQVRPVVAKHPKIGSTLWFNHIAFWHVSSLDPALREMLLAEFEVEGLPYNTYYGDGSTIAPDVIEEIREAYRQETVTFKWQEGDVLMLDNMLVAHGRKPFSGPRKVLAAMGEPFSRTDI